MQKNSYRAVLSLTSKDQGFPPATMYMTPGHFEKNQKENTTHSTSSINGIYLATWKLSDSPALCIAGN